MTNKKRSYRRIWTLGIIVLFLISYIDGQKLSRDKYNLQQQLTEQARELYELREELYEEINAHEITKQDLEDAQK